MHTSSALLNPIATEVRKLSQNPLTGLSEVIGLIRAEVKLTRNILHLANGPYYGLPRQVESLNMFMVVIGMREMSNLVDCISIYQKCCREDPAMDIEEFRRVFTQALCYQRVLAAKGCRNNCFAREWLLHIFASDMQEWRSSILQEWYELITNEESVPNEEDEAKVTAFLLAEGRD